MGRFGRERGVAATAWRPSVDDLRALAARFADGHPPSPSDFNWVHTIDLDRDVEIDSATFRQRFDDPARLEALSALLASVANWIEDSLRRHDVLTVYGY